MTNQYTNNRPLHLGSVDVRIALYSDVSATYESAESIGILDGAQFAVSETDAAVISDNTDDIDLGSSGQQAEISASAWKNVDLSVLNKLMGGAGTFSTTSAGAVSITNEQHKLVGIISYPLVNRNAANAPVTVTDIVVKDSTGATTYALDTDYVVGLNVNGYTTIARVVGGAIDDGEVVKVDYGYTALASKKMTYGSGKIPVYLRAWAINTNAEGKKFIIELYKVSALKSPQMSFGSDKAKVPTSMPISLIGKPDSTRPSGDDTFCIYDEQVV